MIIALFAPCMRPCSYTHPTPLSNLTPLDSSRTLCHVLGSTYHTKHQELKSAFRKVPSNCALIGEHFPDGRSNQPGKLSMLVFTRHHVKSPNFCSGGLPMGPMAFVSMFPFLGCNVISLENILTTGASGRTWPGYQSRPNNVTASNRSSKEEPVHQPCLQNVFDERADPCGLLVISAWTGTKGTGRVVLFSSIDQRLNRVTSRHHACPHLEDR